MDWTLGRYLSLSLFWLGVSLHWTALLSIVLQFQVDRFAPEASRGTYLALLAGAGAAVSAMVQISVGYLSDRTRSRWGRRRPYLVAGVLLNVGALLAMGAAGSYGQVLAAFLAIQLVFNVANGPYQALLPDLVPVRLHGTASMWMGIFQHLGQALGPLLADRLIHSEGGPMRLMALIAAVLVSLMAVTVLAVREPSTRDLPPQPVRLGEVFAIPLKPYPDFVRLLLSRMVINLGVYTALDFLYFYVRYTLGNTDPGATGWLLVSMLVGGFVGGIPVGPLADRWSKVRLIYGCNAVTALAAVLFLLAGDYAQALVAGCVLGMGYGAFAVVDWALACSLMPPGGSARYMGVWNLTAVLPQILAPAVAGPLADLLQRELGSGAAFRYPMAFVLVYLAAGTWLLSGIRSERSQM
ncbi:MAG: MFS transporter [Candidatus Eremiobacterota bacterium]